LTFKYIEKLAANAAGWVRVCVLGAAGGSLNSSVSHGLSSSIALSTRRPGSLVIGSAQMSKSTSEPMNLITDTADVSPDSGLSSTLCDNDCDAFHFRSESLLIVVILLSSALTLLVG